MGFFVLELNKYRAILNAIDRLFVYFTNSLLNALAKIDWLKILK